MPGPDPQYPPEALLGRLVRSEGKARRFFAPKWYRAVGCYFAIAAWPPACSATSPPPRRNIGARVAQRAVLVGKILVMAGSQKTACVEIGGIPIALSTSDDRFLDLLRHRYEGFLSASPPEFELEFDLTPQVRSLMTMFASAAMMEMTSGSSSAEISTRVGTRAPAAAACGRMPTPIPWIRSCAFCTA